MATRRPLDRPAARIARVAGLALGGLGLIAAAVFLLLPLLGRAFVQGVGWLVTACVWVATSISVGVSLVDVLGTIGRAAASGLATPTASVLLTLFVVVGVAAMYWLQRLLESEPRSTSEPEEESSQ
jgi:hypothetical protein